MTLNDYYKRFLPCPKCGSRPNVVCVAMGEQVEDRISCPNGCAAVNTYSIANVPDDWWTIDNENRKTTEVFRALLR